MNFLADRVLNLFPTFKNGEKEHFEAATLRRGRVDGRTDVQQDQLCMGRQSQTGGGQKCK